MLQVAAEHDDVQLGVAGRRAANGEVVLPPRIWLETQRRRPQRGISVAQHLCPIKNLPGGMIVNLRDAARGRRTIDLNGDPLTSPWRQPVERLTGDPAVIPGGVGVERTGPVPLGQIAGRREQGNIIRRLSGAEDLPQGGMGGAASFAVTPARHDHRAGRHACPLPLRPTERLQKGLGRVGFPVSEQNFRVGGQRMQHFRAQDAVLTIACFQLAIEPERTGAYAHRQPPAKLFAVAAKARVQHRDLYPLAAKAGAMPALHAQLIEE